MNDDYESSTSRASPRKHRAQALFLSPSPKIQAGICLLDTNPGTTATGRDPARPFFHSPKALPMRPSGSWTVGGSTREDAIRCLFARCRRQSLGDLTRDRFVRRLKKSSGGVLRTERTLGRILQRGIGSTRAPFPDGISLSVSSFGGLGALVVRRSRGLPLGFPGIISYPLMVLLCFHTKELGRPESMQRARLPPIPSYTPPVPTRMVDFESGVAWLRSLLAVS